MASVQVEDYRVPCDRPLSGFGGSILLCSAGKLFSIRIMFMQKSKLFFELKMFC